MKNSVVEYHSMKTYNTKLIFDSEEDKQHLLEVFSAHRDIWNYLSDFTFKDNQLLSKLSGRILHDLTYYKCKDKFPESPSQIIIRAREDVISTFKTLKTNHHLKDLESSPIKENFSIRLDKRLFTLKGNTIKITTCHKPVKCEFSMYEKLQELFSKHKMCDPLIFVRDNEIYLSITFNDFIPESVPNYCIGVDLGMKRIAVTSEGVVINGNEFLKQKRKIRYIKSYLKRAKKVNQSESARKHLNKVKRKEQNVSKNHIHGFVNEVLKTKANTIVIEDLSGIKSKDKGKRFNNRVSQIPFFMFKQIVTYKAQALGKRVETVNPAFTSKDDFRGIERGERKGCRYYTSDNLVFDADLNASINIALRHVKNQNAGNKLPISFINPVDGFMNQKGRLPSISRMFDAPDQTSHDALARGS